MISDISTPRTVISIDPDDKRWLDREARRRHVPITELVRQAVHTYRVRTESLAKPDLQAALAHTAGIWRGGDGLRHQRRLAKNGIGKLEVPTGFGRRH